jgi:hypothetical protein
VTKRRFERLERRTIRAFRLGLDEYDSWMDEAAVECSDEQWDALCDTLDSQDEIPLTPR